MKNLLFTLSLLLFGFYGFAQTPIFGTVFISGAYDPNGYIVTNGAELYLANGTYYFNPGRGIEVATGGYLQLDGPNITLKCSSSSNYWAGITAYGAPVPYNPGNATEDNWGVVSKHNIIIDKANTGIYMRYEIGVYDALSNSVVMPGANGFARSIRTHNSTTCEFIDNQEYDIRIINNNIADNYSASGGMASSTWNDYKFSSSSPNFIVSMDIQNTNLQRPISKFNISSPTDGIYLSNSNFTMGDSEINASTLPSSSAIVHRILNNNFMPTTIKSSSIKAYKYGVYTRNSENIYVGSNTIKTVEHGIYAQTTESAQFVYNKHYASKYGVEARSCTETNISHNTFIDHGGMSIFSNQNNDITMIGNHIAWNGSSVLSDEGIYVYNSNTVRIIRNLYKRAYRPLSFHGLNNAVYIHCNTFHDPLATIYAAISVFDNPINNQGYGGNGANNYFTLLPPSTLRVRNNTAPMLTFTNTTPVGYGPNFPSINTNFGDNPTYLATCSIPPRLAEDLEENIETSTEITTPTPNPFTDVLQIGENIKSVQIYSLGGQLVESLQVNSAELNLGYLDSGVYFMVFQDNSGQLSRHKLIKQ